MGQYILGLSSTTTHQSTAALYPPKADPKPTHPNQFEATPNNQPKSWERERERQVSPWEKKRMENEEFETESERKRENVNDKERKRWDICE